MKSKIIEQELFLVECQWSKVMNSGTSHYHARLVKAISEDNAKEKFQSYFKEQKKDYFINSITAKGILE